MLNKKGEIAEGYGKCLKCGLIYRVGPIDYCSWTCWINDGAPGRSDRPSAVVVTVISNESWTANPIIYGES